jgi:hypothetical protein
MQDSQTPPSESGKSKRRPTVRWTVAELDEVARAAAKLSRETHIPVSIPAYIKGAVEKRNAELLNGDA